MNLKQIHNNWNNALTQRDRDTVKLRVLGFVVGIAILICLMGCGQTRLDPVIAKEYQKIVKEMRKTYEHVTPRFKHYINGDFSLDPFDKVNFRLSLAVWNGWITKSEKVIQELQAAGILLKK